MKQRLTAVGIVVLLVVTCTAAYVMHQERQSKEEAQAALQRAEIFKSFETVLNDLLITTNTKIGAYRKDRGMLHQLIHPANLRDESYITENKGVMADMIATLRVRSDDILRSFEKADMAIKEIILNYDGDRQVILESWDNFKTNHGELYQQYFMIEYDFFDAYQDLMVFYQVHAHEMTINMQSGRIGFEDSLINQKHDMLKQRLQVLMQTQKQLMVSAK